MFNSNWPEPEITRVVEVAVRTPKNQQDPDFLTRSHHIAQIRRDENRLDQMKRILPQNHHCFSTMTKTKTVSISKTINL